MVKVKDLVQEEREMVKVKEMGLHHSLPMQDSCTPEFDCQIQVLWDMVWRNSMSLCTDNKTCN